MWFIIQVIITLSHATQRRYHSIFPGGNPSRLGNSETLGDRLKHGFGHSYYGRRRYLETCQSKDLLPYQDDLFDYGIYI
jgi:hypothetical protein